MRLGPYEIEAAIGAGGMGQVYRARDTRLNRAVAIKVLPRDAALDPTRLKRFEREARAASALNHPGVLTIFDVGVEPLGSTQDPLHYIATELVDGETLRQRIIRTARLDINDAIDIAIQLAGALAAAHRAGIVHRDLKPENVMVRKDGYVKVLDFGLARLVAHDVAESDPATNPTVERHTQPGMVMGTIGYMSPEQARGLAATTASDVFSLGVLLYEILAGCAPFDGSTTTDVLIAIVDRQPPPLSRLRPTVPSELQRIVTRCLEKNSERRYQSAEELLADLKELRSEDTSGQATPSKIPSVAVLPFVNMSADRENEFFCDGLAEELIAALSRIDRLRVASRTSTFSFRNKGLDVQEIGSALKVGAVLEGSVRKSGTRLRITTQLVNMSDGHHLWSERYDRQLEDIFQVQDEIALAIASALKVKLLGEEQAAIVKRPTLNVEAYQFYLKGRHHWQKWTAEELQKARECFERAIELDPEFAPAYFGLADVCAVESSVTMPPREAWPKAKAALSKALALDPTLAEAWTLTGVYHMTYEWDQMAARVALMRALELDPRTAHAYAVLAQVETFSGRPDEAVAAGRRAVELDPMVAFWNYVLAWVYWAQADYERASHQVEVLREIDPTSWFPHFGSGIVAGALGRREQAVASFEESVRCSAGRPDAVGYLACAYALVGRRADADRQLATLHERAQHGWVPAMSFAIAHFGLGQLDRVFEWLERAYEERDLWLLWHTYDPIFQGLRSDPRMIDLLCRLGRPE
jgi:serine/threonine-protein kinase